MPSGLLYLTSLDRSISNKSGVWSFLLSPCFIEIPVSNAKKTKTKKKKKKKKKTDPDQTPRFAAFGLGLHCLPMSLLLDAWHK